MAKRFAVLFSSFMDFRLRRMLICGFFLVGIPAIAVAMPAVHTAVREISLRVLRKVEPHRASTHGTGMVSAVPGRPSYKALLTLNPELQRHIRGLFARYPMRQGAVVAIEPKTGKIKAYVSHSARFGAAVDVAGDPSPPAASVFKLVTTAALLDSGVHANRKTCYGGGLRRIMAYDLKDDPSRDNRCLTLKHALGYSANAVFAKLATKHLSRRILKRYAGAFGFGHTLPFDVPIVASKSIVPKDRLEFARTAAGFWHAYMSPFHAAMIAATIANDGRMPRPYVVESVLTKNGNSRPIKRRLGVFRDVIPRTTARVLAGMMEETVRRGTAYKAFHDKKGNPYLPGVRVAGKTGTLTRSNPYRSYNWWIGFAPVSKPKIAIAALVVNEPTWHVKASYVAKEALRVALK